MTGEGIHRKVLVVDDEPLVRKTLSLCLRDEYEVTAVASGEEAIAASEKEFFPVVILDLCMEGLSGIETLKRLKQIRETQNVIILTAYQSLETAISALNSGAFNYLTKPFERDHLKRVIARGFEDGEQRSLRKQEMQQRLMSVHDSFFSLLCHEFNTPLNIIMGFSELLSRSLNEPEHAAWAEHVRESGTHLHDVLMEIVDYIGASHLASAGIDEEFVLGHLLEPACETFRNSGTDVEIEKDPVLHQRIKGPSKSIVTIIRKMIRMASHQSQRVLVEARLLPIDSDGNACLQIVVSRTGIRMGFVGTNEIDQLFHPYQFERRGEGEYKTSLGLELATCRKIAEYANGMVTCLFNPDGELDLISEIPVILDRRSI